MQAFIPVILAGGKGERFWPLSRKDRPKQFLSLDGSGKSLLQITADRLLPLTNGWQDIWVVTGAHLADQVRSHLPNLHTENLLVEPEGRDTAPAVAWASLEIRKRYGDEAVIGFFPADHWIADEPNFQKTIRAAARLAVGDESLVMLGMQPHYPATGYGYIEQGDPVGKFAGWITYRVNRFTEKPDYHTAQWFLGSGRYTWNSGIFLFQVGVILGQLRSHAPEILEPIEKQGVAAYYNLPSLSIDYALMEKTNKAYVIAASFGWDDVGDWNSLDRIVKRDDSNVVLANHIGLDTYRSILYSTSENEVIVTMGLEDVVVVRDRDVTLVMHKSRSQQIKQALQYVRNNPDLKHLL